MFPTTSPVATFSRSRLKALTIWVRDELDQLVAREGSNVLRPDDVLILHETFIALYHATEITALDLRATGIHRAVQDICGVATRWPSRLCDDCDQVIALWTAKFGPLNDLRPFLYGRGGRLEGIASATEYTREALLKRWSENCPDKLHHKNSHKWGNLGFRPGDWWINTLFAHHAGIIGLEAVDGGTTFDKYGAYALVLKDTGEVEACHGDALTYRCPQGDRGKFRLTAATPRSRDPIRVLRCHSINSVWGPKAGVRYEGLYCVKGWSIRQAKSTDIAGSLWKEGDILYEVRLERNDPHPMDSLSNRPSATEVDDYTEYKRLRNLYRETKWEHLPGFIAETTSMGLQLLPPTKAAPPIAPPIVPPKGSLNASPTASPIALSTVSLQSIVPPKSPVPLKAAKILDLEASTTVRETMPRHARFDVFDDTALGPLDTTPPPSTASDPSHASPQPARRKGSTLTVPRFLTRNSKNRMSPVSSPQGSPSALSLVSSANSIHTGVTIQSDIREVAPWIDAEASTSVADSLQLSLQAVAEPAPAPSPSPSRRKDSTIPRPSALLSLATKRHEWNRSSTSPRRRTSVGDAKKSLANVFRVGLLKGKDTATSPTGRGSIVARSRNPIAKLLDGAGPEDSEGDDEALLSGSEQERDEHERVASPVPLRLISPESPFVNKRRKGIYSISERSGEDEDLFVEGVERTRLSEDVKASMPICCEYRAKTNEAVGEVTFQELLWEEQKERRQRQRASSDVAPDIVD